jgi:hypothetical protein
MYQRLEPTKIIATARAIALKVDTRFAGSGLSQVAREVQQVAEGSQKTTRELQRPIWGLRIVNILLAIGIGSLLVYVLLDVGPSIRLDSLEAFIQVLEPALGSMVFVGAFILFVWSLETRWKRSQALDRLHALRSLAHVIDMHQLAKDPSRIALISTTESEEEPAELPLDAAQLHDYLDYCSELLSIIGKIGALYAQDLHEPSTLEAADRVESLTVGLARKIWQKMLVLETTVVGRKPLG